MGTLTQQNNERLPESGSSSVSVGSHTNAHKRRHAACVAERDANCVTLSVGATLSEGHDTLY